METAVNYLYRLFEDVDDPDEFANHWEEIKRKVLEAEKLQLNSAYLAGFYDANSFGKTFFNNFYKETFQDESEKENSN